ncbi:hypothetical protein DAI22_06g132900 [Oryza sativa Japonica Group]|nr:hypothetical protein DAI22_06g132900 [Oryza sativa Japonica Group]
MALTTELERVVLSPPPSDVCGLGGAGADWSVAAWIKAAQRALSTRQRLELRSADGLSSSSVRSRRPLPPRRAP